MRQRLGIRAAVSYQLSAIGQNKLAVGRRARSRRIGHDLDTRQLCGGSKRVDDVLPHDAEDAAALPAVH